MANSSQAYRSLAALSKRAHLLGGISGLLGWDQETYMPAKGAPIRAEQRELLAELAHSITTSADYENALNYCLNHLNELSELEQVAVKRWHRDFLLQKKLPTAFVQEFARLTSESIFIWDKAKREDNFALFEPQLIKIIEMLRKKAEYFGYTEHPYDALLDEYEPGMTTKEVDVLFSELATEIPKLLNELIERQEEFPHLAIDMDLTENEQLEIAKKVLEAIGYDLTRGRLDLSSHPFSSACHPDDSRITTRLESHGFVNQVLTILHEAGHAFYEMGLPKEHYGTPLAEAISLGVHESESRAWETRIGRTEAFWEFLLPIAQKMFPTKSLKLTPVQFFREISRVAPTLIRTDSDEVTYPLHVILRFQIEKELLEGTLAVKDLPERWKNGMQKLLGVRPADNRTGCLQDIHWSMGAFGYFPTYTLGNMYAAEFFPLFEAEYPNWQEEIKKGNFESMRKWHLENVHQHGRRYTSQELIQKLTGKNLSAKNYIKYLRDKYLGIFKQ